LSNLFVKIVTAAVIGASSVACVPYAAQAQSVGEQIEKIEVKGNQRIERNTILSYLKVAQGDPLLPHTIDQSLKTLYATGLFSDVKIAGQGRTLVINVVENPVVNNVATEGNRRIEDKDLQSEIQLKSRMIYTRTRVQEDVERILEIYRRSGRYAVTVEPKIIQRSQNRVDVVFEISEGSPTYVRKINFVGNKKFSDSSLRSEIMTQEERWYRFFSASDRFDPDRLTFDRELLRRFYLRNGYADFEVISAISELSPNREDFYLIFTVSEGKRYKLGNYYINTTLRDLDPNSLYQFVDMELGDWYNAEDVEKGIQNLTDAVSGLGYAFVDVKPKINKNEQTGVIEVTFDIEEGPRVFVQEININGNVRTKDEVIRREFRLAEGDAFNSAKLRRSKQRIQNLDFFEKVDVKTEPSPDAEDQTIVNVDVEEKSTGELSFGVGFSSSSGASFNVGMNERNLLGKGQKLSARVSVGQSQTNFDVSFTEPYFLDRQMAAGVDLYHTKTDYEDESSYQLATTGGALRVGFAYNEHLSQSIRYSLSRRELTDVSSDSSLVVKNQEGESVVSMVSPSIIWDHRDSRVNPTEGFFVQWSNDFAGIGGTETFWRTQLNYGSYFSLADDWVLGLRGTMGYIKGFGQDVKLIENFALGGSNLRGFADRGASPEDKASGDRLGGTWINTSKLELRFPTGLPEEIGFTGKIFADAGSIGSPDGVSDSSMNNAEKLRASVGVGFIWESPFGAISVDFAQAVMKQDYDEKEFFRLDFGSQF
jgi:outer membrane protein insertion porin family